MSLYDEAIEDGVDILGDPEGFTVPLLFTSPPPENTEFGTLDPQDLDNQIRGFITDHYTQVNPDTGIPMEGFVTSVTSALKTLLDAGVIGDTVEPVLVDWKVAWLDPVSLVRRDFLIERKHPTRSLGNITIILAELDITP